jgi:hypothetical protein
MSQKQTIKDEAIAMGLIPSYSGKQAVMYFKGDDKKVKTFLRLKNLKGTKHLPFKLAQG